MGLARVRFFILVITVVLTISAAMYIILTSAPASGSCVSDYDCFATGCSGEICASEQIASICIWLPEYGCNQYRNCRCVEGSCEWVDTAEYNECVASI